MPRGIRNSNPPLTWERLDDLFHIDIDTGILIWKKNSGKNNMVGKIAGEKNHQLEYVCVGVDGIAYKRHRLVWFYVHKKWPPADLDHIDGNKKNDSIVNLREASRAQNMWNTAAPITNKSGYKGVSWCKKSKKWRATIRVNGAWHFLGQFDDINDAISARKTGEIKFHEGFAQNRPIDRSSGDPAGCP